MKKIPEHWQLMKLGNCCEIISGSTPKRDTKEYWNGDISWVTPKDLSRLDRPILEDAPEKITEAGYRSCSTSLLPKGAILFSSRAPIGHIAIAGKPMCTNQGFKSLIPNHNIYSPYLYWCMKKYTPNIQSLGTGTTFKEVSKAVIEKFEIPVPPMEEQRRIAAILDQADGLRRKRKEAIRLTDELLRATFLDMFGDPVTNLKGWDVYLLDHVTQKVTDGEHLNPQFIDKGIPMVMANNVRASGITFDDVKYVSIADHEKFTKKCNPEVGDLLLVSRGATIGRSCLVEAENAFCLMGSVILIKVDNSKALSGYLSGCFSQANFMNQLTKTSGASAQQAIYLKDLKKTKIPIPPYPLQKNFCQIYNQVSITRKKYLNAQFYTENLFNSLLQRAFHGEL